MKNKDFVPYTEALELKQLGFDEPCLGYYIELRNPIEGILTIEKCENNKDGCLAQTFSQAFRWFREKYRLHHRIDVQDIELDSYNYEILEVRKSKYNNDVHVDMNFKSYEEAELACLQKLIEIVKDKT